MSKSAPTDIVIINWSQLRDQLATERFDLPAELLRVYSPSAEVRGHSEQERVLQTGKKNVGIKAIEPVGNYAIRITLMMATTAHFCLGLPYDLGNRQEQHWQSYLGELKQANASRLPTIPVGQWQPKKPGGDTPQTARALMSASNSQSDDSEQVNFVIKMSAAEKTERVGECSEPWHAATM